MRILIADDHELIRRGIRSVLLKRADFDVCGEAIDGQDAVQQARQLSPDLIVMDISMPKLNGLDATREIRRILPKIDILMVSQHESPEMMRQAFNAGARGYIVKSALAADLVTGIDNVRRGQMFFDAAAYGTSDLSLDMQEILQRSEAFETALRESEERFRLTFEHASVGIAHVAEDGRWLRVNQKLCEIVGYTQWELRKLKFQDITYPDDLPPDLAQVEKVIAGELDQYSMEKRYIRKNGDLVWINLTVGAVRDPERRLRYFIAVIEDISARKEAQDRQRQAARQQKALFHLADELHRAATMEDVNGAALNAVCAALQCDRGSILLRDQAGVMRFVIWRGLSDEYRQAVTGRSAWKPDDPNPQPICVSDVDNADMSDSLKMTEKAEGIAALAFIPLVSNGKLTGEFIAYFNAAHSLSQQEIELSLTIARQWAFGIEQVTARHRIQRSEERLRLAQAAAQIGTWEWDAAENARTLSPELHAIFGTQADDPGYAEKWASRVDPADWERVQQLMAEGQRSGKMDFEYRYRHPELGLRWLYCKGRRVRNESRMLGVVLEITDRKRMEEALRESEQRLRAIVDTTPECVKLVGPDGTLLHMNSAGLSMVGAECAEMVVGRNVYDLIASEDRERYRLFNERVCRGEKDILEFDIVGLQGARRHMETHAAPLRQPDGTFIQMAVTRDITERRNADRATGLLAAIVSSSDDAIVSKNLDGIVTSWNKGAERLFGYTAKEAIGRNISLVIPPDRLDEEIDILARVRRGERVDHFETVRMRKDGTPFNISVTISPVKDADGRVVGASKVARDVTERKRAEQAVRESEDRLRALSERLESQVRARTMELEQRNADVLRQSDQLRELSWRLLRAQDEERRHIARELHDSAGQTLTVLGMSLAGISSLASQGAPELSKAVGETGKIVEQLTKEIRTASYLLHPPLLDESGLAAALRWYTQGLAERSGLDIALEVSEAFQRLPRDMELVVFRVVQECLTNIHRHSGSHSACIRIAGQAGRISVEVRDNGRGIPPEKLAEIQSQGSGVGIRGMRERVRQFHGEMRIESGSSGTAVFVTIPIPEQPAEVAHSGV